MKNPSKKISVLLKRAYEPPQRSDGFRILVDRVWPRGVRKEKMQADVWMKDLAPSADLRKWFNHDISKWKAFQKAYKAELRTSPLLTQLVAYCLKHEKVTLLFGAKDETHNQAVVLLDFLKSVIKRTEGADIVFGDH
ncbi:MAG TPA: DUF488 family protein [Flavisolibacter sp.]|nr:DUF488 family protein [Flavisolibacter sp.]